MTNEPLPTVTFDQATTTMLQTKLEEAFAKSGLPLSTTNWNSRRRLRRDRQLVHQLDDAKQ
jgi:hypothetical protein